MQTASVLYRPSYTPTAYRHAQAFLVRRERMAVPYVPPTKFVFQGEIEIETLELWALSLPIPFAAKVEHRPSNFIRIIDIQRAVAGHYGIRRSDMLALGRETRFSFPRQVAGYLSRKLTRNSYPEIGRRFGGRDHTTQIHAFQKIEGLLRVDPEVAADVDAIIKTLANGGVGA